jgi:hypothetical protein
MAKCPLEIRQLVIELKRSKNKEQRMDMPHLLGWTVVDITNDPDGWFAIVSHKFEEDKNPHTRTITPLLWEKVYHPNSASAVSYSIQQSRDMIDELYSVINLEKRYLYRVEKMGILINNNNKQGNPLDIDLF